MKLSHRLLIFLFLFTLILNKSNQANKDTHQTPCTTPACVQAVNDIKKNMDDSVDPCEDFYHFACGKYVKEAKIPSDKPFVNTFAYLVDDIQDKTSELIRKLDHSKAIRPFSMLKRIYEQCMNIKNNEVADLQSFLAMIKNLGNWPVLVGSGWKENQFEWTETIFRLRELGFRTDIILTVNTDLDPKNTSRRILSLNQPALGVAQEIFNKDEEDVIVKAYYEFMVKIAVKLGAEERFAREDLKETFEFEKSISKISLSTQQWWNAIALYNPITIEDLQRKHPTIPVIKYIEGVLNIPDIKIDKKEVIIVKVPSYLVGLEQLLKTTSKRILANYIIWRVISSTTSMLTEDLRNITNEFENIKTGNSKFNPRKQECFEEISDKMHLAVGAIYVRNHFDKRSKKIVEEIIDSLIKQFTDMLKQLNWMYKETAKNALEKASFISKYVAFSDELLNDNKLINYYANLSINQKSYFLMVLQLNKFDMDVLCRTLRKPVNRNDWLTKFPPYYVNAVYAPTLNEIEVPAGILQNVFFNADRPQYLNYGGIGYVIGHEITHGFDGFGKNLDKHGNLQEWWSNHTNDHFQKKIQCFIEQYGKYEVPEVKLRINGANTLNENIADNGGIKQAYLAYKSYVKKNGVEPLLKGLNFTQNQLFWIGTANVFCSKFREEYLKLVVLMEQHAHVNFRIIGSLSNMEYFAEDFKCPSGSKMNPVQKCSIW